jgi:cupin 2 domain-containing protein
MRLPSQETRWSLPVNNLFADIPQDLPEELFESLAQGNGVHIERIVSRGHSSPLEGWHEQAQAEWVMVVRGRASIAYTDKPSITLEAGDYVNIAAGEKHKVEWTSPDEDTIWLAVHY